MEADDAKTYVVPDTNIFLHYKHFTELHWADEIGASPLTVLITRTVLGELDRHKRDSKNQRRAKRAREVGGRLTTLLLEHPTGLELRPGVTLVAAPFHSIKAALNEHDLDPDEGDERLLAEILTRMGHEPSARIILHAGDGNALVRASQLGVEVKLASDHFLLPNEPDPLEQENRRLRAENDALKNTAPRLQLMTNSQSGAAPLKISLPSVPTLDPDEVRRRVKAECQRLIDRAQAMVGKAHGGFMEAFHAPSKEEVSRFNHEMIEYRSKLERYIVARHDWPFVHRRSLCIELDIHNDGKGPANDVYLLLDIPRSVRLFIGFDKIQEPEPPRPPEQPRSSYMMATSSFADYSLLRPDLFSSPEIDHGPFNSWSIDIADDAYHCAYRIERVMHTMPSRLDPLWIVFPIDWGAEALSIRYAIHAANLREEVSQNITILTEASGEDSGAST